MDTKNTPPPLCPACGRSMRLERVISEEDDVRKTNAFYCRPCGVQLILASDKQSSFPADG
jgi:hypothetical protein